MKRRINTPLSTRTELSRINESLQARKNRKIGKVGTANIDTSVDASFEGSENSNKKIWIF